MRKTVFDIHRRRQIQSAFRKGDYKNEKQVWQDGLNERYWTHGLVLSQGNQLSVSQADAIRRLDAIGRHLLRQIFGSNWRRRKANIEFLIFQHGDRKHYDQHFHAVLHIEGKHAWSDFRIAKTIESIERMKRNRPSWQKPAHIDWDWQDGNKYHSYIARYAKRRPDTWVYHRITD